MPEHGPIGGIYSIDADSGKGGVGISCGRLPGEFLVVCGGVGGNIWWSVKGYLHETKDSRIFCIDIEAKRGEA